MKKDGLDEKAREVEAGLREAGLTVYYQDSGSIGRRYARADEIGVPYCVTVDYETLRKTRRSTAPSPCASATTASKSG